VVWLPVLAGDSREGLDPTVLEDERVQQFWDAQQSSGRWFGRHGFHTSLLWDAYLVYGPHARWTQTPGPLQASGSPVIAEAERLRRALAPYLRE
jgi:hypothetical protein